MTANMPTEFHELTLKPAMTTAGQRSQPRLGGASARQAVTTIDPPAISSRLLWTPTERSAARPHQTRPMIPRESHNGGGDSSHL